MKVTLVFLGLFICLLCSAAIAGETYKSPSFKWKADPHSPKVVKMKQTEWDEDLSYSVEESADNKQRNIASEIEYADEEEKSDEPLEDESYQERNPSSLAPMSPKTRPWVFSEDDLE